jgi:signal peptidase II
VDSALLLSACLVFFLDHLTKALVIGRLALGESVPIGRWLQIRHVVHGRSPQVASGNPLILLCLWGLAVGIVILAIREGSFFHSLAAQIGLGAALGGAAGNLYDRLRRGGVIDFVDLGWWPVFNLADVALTIGALTALVLIR